MTSAQPLDERPVQIARRIAVASALSGAGADGRLTPMLPPAHAVLVDDLCRLSFAADAAGVPDTVLACAAVEGQAPVSIVARVVYGARSLLRAAKLEPPSVAGSRRTLSFDSIDSAVAALGREGIRVAYAPRHFVRLIDASGGALHADPALKMLAAAHSSGTAPLIDALCSAPFSLEPASVQDGFAQASGSPRDALASAIGRLRGASAKDAAVAALRVLDAALSVSPRGWSLPAAIAATRAALAEVTHAPAADEDELMRAARAAEKIWNAQQQPAAVSVRLAAFVESVATVRAAELTFVPFVAEGSAGAGIVFADALGQVMPAQTFARELELDAEILASAGTPELLACVGASVSEAAVGYLRSQCVVESRRAWPAPEPLAPVKAANMTFSASRLNSYVKCPRRFFYEYLCEALDDPGSLHTAYGRVMHDALERLHREVRFPALHEPALVLEKLLRALDAAFGAARSDFASQLEYETSRWRARRMAEQYVRWLAAESKRDPVEISGVEVFERRNFAGHEFVGYIDRIDKPVGGGPITIYDYKTGRIDPDARTYLDKVRAGEEAQLALYYAFRSAAGDEIRRIALVSIRDPRDEVWILALDVRADGAEPDVMPPVEGVLRAACSPKDLEASLAALVQRCDMLTAHGAEHFPAGDDPPCSFCAYARACRERPVEGERAFAR
jgi:RecB family exonuclease